MSAICQVILRDEELLQSFEMGGKSVLHRVIECLEPSSNDTAEKQQV